MRSVGWCGCFERLLGGEGNGDVEIVVRLLKGLGAGAYTSLLCLLQLMQLGLWVVEISVANN